jgi:hypothetical protein
MALAKPDSSISRQSRAGMPARTVKAYTDGWSKWSNGALKPDTVVHFAIDEELLDFAKATFAHEAGAVSPLHDDQILYGFALERQTT